MKKALLIAGAGTLGSYTTLELIKLGWQVDVIGLEDLHFINRNVTYIRGTVDDAMLKELFEQKRYDTIIDYIHYPDPEAYKGRCQLLLDNTDQLIFLSSYRVYADCEHPVRETSPLLIDTVKDPHFLQCEKYAVPKTYNERTLRASGRKNWTIVRPLISFSHFRLDLVTQGAPILLSRSRAHKPILLPETSRLLTAGVGWAGNIGKMFARLCGNEKALGETYTLGTGESRTWEEVAGYYAETLGATFEWIPLDDYAKCANTDEFILLYDRVYDRRIDASKIQEATGLTAGDFTSIRDGIIYELDYLSMRPDLTARFDNDYGRRMSARMDEWLQAHRG